jgi:hypothetical protein
VPRRLPVAPPPNTRRHGQQLTKPHQNSGKVSDLKVTSEGATKSATVTFEKETAMRTALLLNNTQLGPNTIVVTGEHASSDDDGSHFAKAHDESTSPDEISQEQKPRSRILAEYLAHGYVIGDATLQRAIELDKTHGMSKRFLGTLQTLDKRYHATDRARAADQSYGLSAKGMSVWQGLGSYFEKATNTPTGKKIVHFYEEGSKQVQDIHAEALRLAELKKDQHGGSVYKAAGLEKVFGKEKEAQKPATEGQGSGPPAGQESAPVSATTASAAPTS